MEATVDPQPRGPDWMPITPKTGSLFHADSHYCTGYLGDIGVAPPYGPMDFAGWFEAYLGGRGTHSTRGTTCRE